MQQPNNEKQLLPNNFVAKHVHRFEYTYRANLMQVGWAFGNQSPGSRVWKGGRWKGGFASTKNDNFHTIRLHVCVCSFVVRTANTNKWVMHAIYRLYPIRWALLRQLWPGFQYIALFFSLVSAFFKRIPRAPPLLTHERRSHCLQAFHTHISLGYHLNLQIMIGEFWHFPRSLTRSRPKIAVRCTRKR